MYGISQTIILQIVFTLHTIILQTIIYLANCHLANCFFSYLVVLGCELRSHYSWSGGGFKELPFNLSSSQQSFF